MKDIRVEWYDRGVGQWVTDQYLGSLAQALAYAHEEVQICGEDHRVIVGGQVYALLHAMGGES